MNLTLCRKNVKKNNSYFSRKRKNRIFCVAPHFVEIVFFLMCYIVLVEKILFRTLIIFQLPPFSMPLCQIYGFSEFFTFFFVKDKDPVQVEIEGRVLSTID